jgi:phosphatidylglycerol:prolipoprotein diacylglycerol transferase
MCPIFYTIPESIPIIGGLSIYAYGVMLGTAFISGWYLAFYFSNREGISYKSAATAFGLAIVFALIGARVAHLISNPHTWRMQGFINALLASKCEGLVAYGGYIGGVLAVYFYTRYKKIDFWSFVDCATPSMIMGLGLTRIGCFLAGCCHGQPTDVPWAMIFPPGSQASSVFPGEAGHSLAVHPTQIYESLVGWALLPLALYVVKRRKFTGQAFLTLMICYAVARFMLEIIRGDTDRGYVIGPISTSQFIGIVLIVFAIIVFIYRKKHAPAPPEPLSKEEIEERLIAEGVIKTAPNKSSSKKKKSNKK